MAKVLKSFEGFRRGTKFKIVGNSNSHNYPIGKILVFKQEGSARTQMNDVAEGVSGNTIDIRDIRLLNESVSELHQKIVELQEELDATNGKIKLCGDLGLTEYDENVIKVHKALEVIKTKKTDLEKSQAIANLILNFE